MGGAIRVRHALGEVEDQDAFPRQGQAHSDERPHVQVGADLFLGVLGLYVLVGGDMVI